MTQNKTLIEKVAKLAQTHTWCFAKDDEAKEFAREVITALQSEQAGVNKELGGANEKTK